MHKRGQKCVQSSSMYSVIFHPKRNLCVRKNLSLNKLSNIESPRVNLKIEGERNSTKKKRIPLRRVIFTMQLTSFEFAASELETKQLQYNDIRAEEGCSP